MRSLIALILTVLTLTAFGQDRNSTDSTNYIFVSEPMPSYPGGHAEMIKFIGKNLKYPRHSRTVQGKVYVEFVVGEDGSLSDFRIVKGLAESFDRSALQALTKMPSWIPAKRDNIPIRTKIVIPVTF